MKSSLLVAIRRGRQSIRTQLILGAIIGLTLVLALFGLFVRYVVSTTLMNSVDSNLQERILQSQHHPPPHRPGDNGPGGPFQGFLGNGPGGSGPFSMGDSGGHPADQPFDQDQRPTQPDQFPQNGQQQPGGNQGFDQQQPGTGGPPDQGPDAPPNSTGAPPDNANNPGSFREPTAISPTSANVLNQLDQLYHPRRFTSTGMSMDRFNNSNAWDVKAIRTANSRNRPVFSSVISNGVHLRVLTEPVHTPDGQEWFFQAPYPMAETDRAIDGVDHALLLLIPVALIIAGIGGALLTRRMLGRVGQLVHTAAGIGANDLSQRLPVIGSDEFAELADTFNALLARVEEAFLEQQRIVEQQRRFTADASHELKTPLTLIRGTTSMALSTDGILDRQSTSDVDDAAASMSELVQDLIYLARSDSGQLGRQRIDLLLIEPLQRAIERITCISEAPIRLVEANENLLVNADESEMVRLFTNILQNAAYHTPSDGRIIVSLSSTSTEAIVMVNDSGIGIAPKHIEHLGERFYRIDSSRTRTPEAIGGSGLGLAICLGIIDAHGGTISFDSVLGKGTTVTVTLPKASVD